MLRVCVIGQGVIGNRHADIYQEDPLAELAGVCDLRSERVALFERESMIRQSNISQDRIQAFAIGQIDASGFLDHVLEKPDAATLASMPRPHWLSMNCWRFGPSIFEACRNIEPSKRGELELPDAVQYAIDVLQDPFEVVRIRAPVLDLTSRKDVALVAKKLAGVEVSL